MKNLKLFVVISMMLFVGTCFGQQGGESKKDSIWGISVDTTETDMLLHLDFMVKRLDRIATFIVEFYENEGGALKGTTAFQFWMDQTPVAYSSKYVDTLSFHDNGGRYEVVVKMPKQYYTPANIHWRFMRIYLNSFMKSYSLPSNWTSLNELDVEKEDNLHRYASKLQLNESHHGEYYADCLFLQNNQMFDRKKCYSR